jgi:hypothetical protein
MYAFLSFELKEINQYIDFRSLIIKKIETMFSTPGKAAKANLVQGVGHAWK